MGEEADKMVESKPSSTDPPPTETPQQEQPPSPPSGEPAAPANEKPKDVAEAETDEKALVPVPAPDQKTPESTEKKPDRGSIDRDAVLAKVESEKRLSLIRAWEDSEKCKAENKAVKKISSIDAWENSKKASIEAEIKSYEEKMEKKKAEYAENLKNKIAMIHKEAEERKAMVEAKKGEELLKAEEIAAKYRATGKTPKKMFGCF